MQLILSHQTPYSLLVPITEICISISERLSITMFYLNFEILWIRILVNYLVFWGLYIPVVQNKVIPRLITGNNMYNWPTLVYILLLETSGLGRGKNKENKDQIQNETSKIIDNQVTIPYKDKIHSGYNLAKILETLSRFTGWTGIARGLPPVPKKLGCSFQQVYFMCSPVINTKSKY